MNIHGKCNFYPIEAACDKGHLDVVMLLLNNGADISGSIWENCKQLTKGKYDNIHDVLAVFKIKRQQQAQQNTPERKNEHGEPPLVAACRTGNIEWLKEITEDQPYAIFSTHKTGKGLIKHKKTLMYTACKHGNENIVDFLINKGGDINMCNSDGKHPLYAAASKGYGQIVKKLLQNDVDIKEFDKCIAVATKNNHDSLVNMLETEKKNRAWYDNPERYARDNLAFALRDDQ